jgi:hypothetical protein
MTTLKHKEAGKFKITVWWQKAKANLKLEVLDPRLIKPLESADTESD